MKKIAIIDYGCGNIRSVYNAFNLVGQKINLEVNVTSEKKQISESTHLVLPGVGSFQSCIEGLKNSNLLEIIFKKTNNTEIPFLGICVGMQMMASKSFENGEFNGLDWISGEVHKLSPTSKNLKIPHMGWNNLNLKKETNFIKNLKKKINVQEANAYFVHSYNFKTNQTSEKIMTTEYGQEITAMVEKNNLIGTQFHPEKSHLFGLAFLETFVESSHPQ